MIRWVVFALLAGCAGSAIEQDPNPDGTIYRCDRLGQFMVCKPEQSLVAALMLLSRETFLVQGTSRWAVPSGGGPQATRQAHAQTTPRSAASA